MPPSRFFFVLVFNYFLFRILPGDILSMLARSGKTTPEMLAGIRELYGLDLPWYQQFFVYLQNLFTEIWVCLSCIKNR